MAHDSTRLRHAFKYRRRTMLRTPALIAATRGPRLFRTASVDGDGPGINCDPDWGIEVNDALESSEQTKV